MMRTVVSSGSISSVSVSLCLQRASGTVRSVPPSIHHKRMPINRSSTVLHRSGNTHRWHSMLMDLLDWRECHRNHQRHLHFPGCGAAHNRKNAYYLIHSNFNQE
uniref:Putative secreted protein n=1 Tax=Anopheles triannulatus TaxID=58253 RepID=A0A2M4B4E5_9DIPT